MLRKSNKIPHLEGIIETKIRSPASNDAWVARPRLIRSLNGGHRHRLILVSAPAGFGKTVLALQWLRQLDEPCAWLSLDDGDNREDSFFRYLMAAIRAGIPGLESAADAYLKAFQTPPPSVSADQLLADFCTHREPFTLVLDDVHTLKAPAVLTLLSRLMDRLPEHVRFLMLSRNEPDLPLSKHRLSHQLHLISASDLLFSKLETDAFLTRAFGRKNEPQMVDLLYEKSGGWIAALALARFSPAGAYDPKEMASRLSESRTGTADFLMDEVVQIQPRSVQAFLCSAVLFDRFSPALLDAALSSMPDLPPARSTMERLLHENLLITPLDDKHGWYRCHDLMRQLLTDRLTEKFGRDETARMRRHGARWLVDNGLLEEAMKQFLAAGDETAAAELLARHMGDFDSAEFSRRSFARFLDLFPDEARKNNVLVVTADIFHKCQHWDLVGVAALLDIADTLLADPACALSPEKRQKFAAALDGIRCFCLYWKGDPERALDAGLRALENTSEERRHWEYHAVMYTGAALAMLGREAEAMRLLSEQTAQALAAGNLQAGGFLTIQMGIYYYAFDLEGTRQTADRILELYEQGAVHTYWYLHALYFLGCVAYERNFLDVAAQNFDEVKELRYQINTRPGHDAILGGVLTALAQKQWKEAAERAAFARAFALEAKDAYSLMLSESLRTREAIVKGDSQSASTVHSPEASSNFMWIENPIFTHAEYLLCTPDADKHRQAAAFLDQAKARLSKQANRRQHLQLDAVRSVALYKIGRRDDALSLLRKTLEAAEPLGLVRTFLDRGKTMAELLLNIVQKDSESAYVKRLLSAFDEASLPTYLDTPFVSGDENRDAQPPCVLSLREQEVLHHLQGFASLKEIAYKLCISPETVKKHTNRIYRKLKVNNRAQAVAAAKMSGLI